MSTDRGVIGLHGVLRHLVPPAPVVPATRGWLFRIRTNGGLTGEAL